MGRIDSANDITETQNNHILNKMDVCFYLTSKCETLGRLELEVFRGPEFFQLSILPSLVCGPHPHG